MKLKYTYYCKMAFFMFIFFAILSIQNTAYAEETQNNNEEFRDNYVYISGLLSLPEGKVAPEGGIEVLLNVSQNSTNNGSSVVTIPSGSHSVEYALPITYRSSPDTNFLVAYYINSPDNSEFISSGFYVNGTTTSTYATQGNLIVEYTSISNVNISILQKSNISGTLSLPMGKVAPKGGIKLNVQAMPTDPDLYCGSSSTVIIPEGASSVSYTISVNAEHSAAFYINYKIVTGGNDYCSNAYYQSNGSSDFFSASPVVIDQMNTTNIDFSLIEGRTLSGKIYLPAGKTAPKGGLYVNVDASMHISVYIEKGIAKRIGTNDPNETGTYSIKGVTTENDITTVFIPEGKNAVVYKLHLLPHTDNLPFLVMCRLSVKGSITGGGYYSIEQGFTHDYDTATKIFVGKNDTIVNIPVLFAKTISGTISLPQGRAAPKGGLAVEVFAQTGKKTFGAYVIIPEGCSTTAYLIALPSDVIKEKICVGYAIINNTTYRIGYFDANGTTTVKKKADPLDISVENVGEIDMVLIPVR